MPFGATALGFRFFFSEDSRLHQVHRDSGVETVTDFDNYSALCTTQSEADVTFSVESLLKLLGVIYAASAPKALDFSERFKSLGLEFDLEGVEDGCFKLES